MIEDRIRDTAFGLGFDAAGIAAPEPLPYPGMLRRWLAAGCHATMGWMERRVEQREDVRRLIPGVKSVVCVALNSYNSVPGGSGVATYARNVDYHLIFAEKLRRLAEQIRTIIPLCSVRAFCDTSAVLERAWAERAGIGWIGKNAHLMSRRFGAWLLLGGLLVDRELRPDQSHPNMCGRCDRCLRACPTGAIRADYTVDSRRCISYLTIEHRGEIPADLAPALGGHLFGCDLCLAACPFNRFQRETSEPRLLPGPHLKLLDEIPRMDEAEFKAHFGETPLARPKLAGMQRNYALSMMGVAG
ncbi:MAG: tRNA epoxyqueuosine(34) reductase QueG [Acidobacteriota bacterium]